MKKVNLTMDSRIISHLGEALISDEKIALLELIKNSSDADALNCNIEIDTHYESQYGLGKITLEDNGNGMNAFIIENAFLRIATSFKTKYQKQSPIYKRLALGSKGIGRLSLNQLGNYVEVETKLNTEIFNYVEDLKGSFGSDNITELIEENENFYYNFAVNWMDFNNSSLSLEEVNINLKKIEAENKIFCGNSVHGTKISVYGLKGTSFWEHKNTKKELEKDVLSFINPYLSKKFNFKVKIDLNNEVFRNDIYDKKRIEKMSDVTSSFWFVAKEKVIRVHVKRNPHYIKYLIDNLIERMKQHDYDCENLNIDYQQYYSIYGEEIKEFFLDPKSIVENFPQAKSNSLYMNEDEEYLLPGDFEGVFYGFNRESKDSAAKSEIRNLLNNIVGVKMYRNDFRIFPYGEEDWLGFGKISQTQISNIYRPNNTTGYVYINGEENLRKLKELTNREGLIQDKYGKNFLVLMKDYVAKFAAVLDNKLRADLNIDSKKRSSALAGDILTLKKGNLRFKKREDPHVKAEKSVQLVQKDLEEQFKTLKLQLNNQEGIEKINKISKDVEENFTIISKNLREIEGIEDNRKIQIESEKEYINQFYPIIGATIVAETLSHEIIRLSNNIKHSSLAIRNTLKKDIVEVNKNWIFNHLSLIDSNTKFLSRYASLLDVNSHSKRRRYEIENLKDHVYKVFKHSPLLTYKDMEVEIKILGDGFEHEIVREGFNIVLENLIINSVYWLEKMRVENPCICLKFNKEKRSIKFWDNGFGIHSNISEDLFEPFKTNKPQGEGRGMGLFIVRELLKEISADISLLRETNSYGNRFIFEIVFIEERRQ